MITKNQVNNLKQLFHANTHDENAVRMAQYMKGHFPFFGIKSGIESDSEESLQENESYLRGST